MILEWLNAVGKFWLAVLLLAGIFGLVTLVLPAPENVHFLINLVFLLIGIILGGGSVHLWTVQQLQSLYRMVRALNEALKESMNALRPFNYPTILLPKDASIVILTKPDRPSDPVYRVARATGRDRYLQVIEENRAVFQSDPNQATFSTNEMASFRAAIACANLLQRDEQFFIEELSARTIGVSVSEGDGGEDENFSDN